MKNKVMRILMGLGVITFAIIVPAVVVFRQYSLGDKIAGSSTGAKVIGIILMLSITCLIAFRKFIHDAIHNMEFSIFKCVLTALSRVSIFILLVILIRVVENNIASLKNCFDWFLASAIIAYGVFEPLYYMYDTRIKDAKKKKIVKEALAEGDNSGD